MPLQTTHRPVKLSEFYGNDALKASLESVLSREEDVPPSFLFIGRSGCGKTTLGRIVANELGGVGMDVKTYNASNTRGIDTIREVIKTLPASPMLGKKKIYIFEEAAGITGAAAEAMLLMLEEPPKHVHFVLCTTEPEKLKPTIKRRCHIAEVSPLDNETMLRFLKDIVKKEGINDYPENILKKVVYVSDGSPGKALSVLDSIIDIEDDDKAVEAIETKVLSETTSKDICRLLLDENTGSDAKWKDMVKIIKGLKVEPEQARRGILGYLEKVLWTSGSDRVAEIMELFVEPLYNSGQPGLSLILYSACKI